MPIAETFARHHKLCDEVYAQAEQEALKKKWEEAGPAFERFRALMERHLGTEEQTLFPAFEERTGMSGGPTQVMRMEHVQMRALMEEMAAALAAKDAVGFGGAGETLLVLMQQHNMKEENILYPMCEQALGHDGPLADALAKGLDGKG